jgi:anaerobic selenocysteine-containing dehydrogenase
MHQGPYALVRAAWVKIVRVCLAACAVAAGHYWGSISSDCTCESVESADIVLVVGAVSHHDISTPAQRW